MSLGSTKKDREEVLEKLAMSPQSRESLGTDDGLHAALHDLVEEKEVVAYTDGEDNRGQAITMYRLKGQKH